ncbi:class I SAM-dependent methyltransferase [Actinomycetospora sp. C-140]
MATAREPAAGWTVELDTTPGRRQAQEEFLLRHPDGETERITLHDYARVYSVPGLYEDVVQRRLECASPATVAEALVEAAGERGVEGMRAFDLGAGNGVVGEELRDRGVTVVAGADGVPEAREAAHRDRPGLYAHYLVGERLDVEEVTRLVRDEGLTALVAAGAVGQGHVPVDALAQLWEAFPPGSYLALTLAAGDEDHDVTDVEAMLAATAGSAHPSRTVVRRRFRHRVSMAGTELFYLVLVAVKE